MITIVGASGFIGSHLARRLKALGVEFEAIERNDAVPARNLGDIIYCIGVTADFRSRTFDTVEAHVCSLLRLLRNHQFDSLLYLSSARLYAANDSTDEQSALLVNPRHGEDLYNISKAMGESLALNCSRPARIARISNVYGPDFNSSNFPATILKQAVDQKRIVLQTTPDSVKDYISLEDVLHGLIQIARGGREQIYNVASGINVSHAELAQRLQTLTGCDIVVAPDAPTVKFPEINVERMRSEFNFTPSSVLDDLPRLVQLYEGRKSHT